MNVRQVVDMAKDWSSWSLEVTGSRPYHEDRADGREADEEEEDDDDDVICVSRTHIPFGHRQHITLTCSCAYIVTFPTSQRAPSLSHRCFIMLLTELTGRK